MEQLGLLETRYVKLGFRRIPVRLSFRAMIEFEKMTNSSIKDVSGTENLVKLFYCAARAGALHLQDDLGMDYDEFLTKVERTPKAFVEFTDFLMEGVDDDSEKKSWMNILTLT